MQLDPGFLSEDFKEIVDRNLSVVSKEGPRVPQRVA